MGKGKLFIGRRNKIKWGVAGCGRFSENAVLPVLTQLKKSTVTSVYSSDESRSRGLANKFSIDNHFSDYEKFLKSDFDALYIGSANHNHYRQVIEAAKKHKHILCEKPLALNSRQAEEMYAAATENGVYLSVNYVHRFHPLLRKAKELIDKGMLGKIISVEASFNIDYPPDSNFRFVSESGGGPLMDVGTHMIDLLRYLNGEIIDAKGFKDNVIYRSDVEDFACGILKFENLSYGIMNVSFNAKKAVNQIYILGHSGYITIDRIIASKNVHAKLTIDLDGEARKTFRRRANMLLIRFKEFQKSMRKNEIPEITGLDGLNNIKIMEMLNKDAAN